jgi:hypothetical protein|tara:strand:- start:295 stop:501 length:207 start_codon:yes stop_codon:yes gene_type:complete
MSQVTERMKELMMPIDQQIMMCDDREDILMLACVMIETAKRMLDTQIGVDGRNDILNSCKNTRSDYSE